MAVGIGYPGNWVHSTPEMPPSFFYCPITSAGMATVVFTALEHDHNHFRTEK
jgi:hypothetical protein